MPDFLKLTWTGGSPIWINPAHVVSLEATPNGTLLRLVAGFLHEVTETPEQILAEIEDMI